MARTPLQQTDPTQLGRYRLVSRLGAGGMGVEPGVGELTSSPGLKVRGFLPCRSGGTSEGSCFTGNRPRKQGSYVVSAGV